MDIKATDIKDFQAEVFCITGSIPHWSRGDLFTQIEVRDGEYVDRMTKSVTVLVYGYRTGAKIDKALQYGTKLMEWREFLTLLAMTPIVDTEKAKHIQSLSDGTPRKYLGGAHVVQPMDKETHPQPLPASEGSMHQEPANDNGQWSMVNGQCQKDKWRWVSELVSGIAAVLILLVKGLTVVCGLAICVCLWLVGIPAKP